MKTIQLKNEMFKYEENRDISPFILNNWIEFYRKKTSGYFFNALDIFNILYKNKCAIWIDSNGDICYRLSIYDDIKNTSWKKIGFVFHNFLNLDVEIKRLDYDEEFVPRYRQVTDENKNKLQYYIYLHQLQMIHTEIFFPEAKAEFFKINNLIYRNTFKPTSFLTNYLERKFQPEYSIILQYIDYLSNYNKDRFYYIINWLANMFNNLQKSNIALVLISSKKREIEIFFNEIIKPLFGFEYCIEIDDNDLANGHFDKLFKEKLFFNFDDISYDTSTKKVKNICKEVIESNELYLDYNNKEIYKKTDIFAQTLITSSKAYIPILDLQRHNYSVFNVNGEFLKNRKSTIYNEIKDDLNHFSSFLKSFKVDVDYANTSFKNDDIDIVLDYDKNIYEIFTEAIKNKDKDYFQNVKKDNKLYKELIYDFDRDRIKRANLIKYFNIIYPNESISSTRGLLSQLRKDGEILFDKTNIKPSNSEQYFIIQ